MKLPRGRLERRRVVGDLATPLANALDAELTGYCRLESQDALLLEAEGIGVLTFEGGIPMAAYHTGTDAAGPAALADIAVSGPYRIELFALPADALESVHDAEGLRVPPAMPARRLAGDQGLADRTRERAPDARLDRPGDEEGAEASAVEAFLADEERIQAIQSRAREEAERRAAEWGLDDVVEDV
jgi:hypothetical protein